MSADRTRERAERVDHPLGEAGEPIIWMRPEPGSRRAGLSRERIAAAALEIADEEGFDAVSMRRVAQRLQAGTMTLYHYVRNKDELITLMFDAVMGEVVIPEGELAGAWRPALTQIATRSREAFRRHRWALDRLGDGRPGPNGLRHFEQTLEAVAELDHLDRVGRFELISLIDDYVFGFALREAQELAEHERGFSPQVAEFFQHELDSGRYPLVSRYIGRSVEEANEMVNEMIRVEGRFERGLERLLDGVEGAMAR